MGLESAVDFEAIARPIDGDAPAGPNLRAESPANSLYWTLKEVRRLARAAEDKLHSGGEYSESDLAGWQRIRSEAQRLLAQQSKDIEVAAWLAEALVRLDGFGGLAVGFRVLRVLVESFWEGLWPRPDGEGARLAPLNGLNGEESPGTLIAPIARVPLVLDPRGEFLAAWQYTKAREISRIDDPERRERAIQSAGVTLDSFDAAIAATSAEDLRRLEAELNECLAEHGRLVEALDRICGDEAPHTSQTRNAIQEVLDVVRHLGRDKLAGDPEHAAPDPSGAPAEGAPPSPSSTAGVRGREEAFGALVRVADFFRRTEPHSPLSYLLEQAVRWGRLPLPALLDELIPDEGARIQYMKLTGIPVPERE